MKLCFTRQGNVSADIGRKHLDVKGNDFCGRISCFLLSLLLKWLSLPVHTGGTCVLHTLWHHQHSKLYAFHLGYDRMHVLYCCGPPSFLILRDKELIHLSVDSSEFNEGSRDKDTCSRAVEIWRPHSLKLSNEYSIGAAFAPPPPGTQCQRFPSKKCTLSTHSLHSGGR